MRKHRYLWQEILVILLLKMALILTLRRLFFSDPLDKKLYAADIPIVPQDAKLGFQIARSCGVLIEQKVRNSYSILSFL